MKNVFILLLGSVLLSLISFKAGADGHLPKSGTISWVTGWHMDSIDLAPQTGGYALGSIAVRGATFNTNGSGPLHEGRALCVGTYIVTPDGATNKGNCAFGDQDGDRIFTTWTGNAATNQGINTIMGGTGKYAGITGSGPWLCFGPSSVEDDNAFNCRQSLTYELP